MQISTLMEKTEAGMYRLMACLAEEASPLSFKRLSQETDLSRTTVLKYLEGLEALIRVNALPIKMTLTDDTAHLQVSEALEWSYLLQLLLEPAIKYQILDYLFQHRHFHIQALSQKLLVSEATLHRHLSGLNDLLEAFGISISNGHWQGSEHQIRYFYWLLYQQVWTAEAFQKMGDQAAVQRAIQLVERLCQTTLPEADRYRIGLWMAISKGRWSAPKKETEQLRDLLLPYQGNTFFQRLERACLRYLSRYAVELDEAECHIFFAFLVSTGMLPHHTMTFLLGFGGPLADQMTAWIRQFREENICGQHLPDVVSDTLGQILHQQYFFRGSLWKLPKEYHYQEAYFASLTMPNHIRLAERLLPDGGTPSQETYYYRWQLLALLAYLNKPVQESLRIGLAVTGGELGLVLFQASLEKELGYNRLVSLLPYEADQSYDGIIASQWHLKPMTCPIYRLHAPMRGHDKAALKDWVNGLLENSLCRTQPAFPSY